MVESPCTIDGKDSQPARTKQALWKGVSPQRAAFAERGPDFYRTAREAVVSLLALEKKHLPKSIWEPACGDGAIVLPFREAGLGLQNAHPDHPDLRNSHAADRLY